MADPRSVLDVIRQRAEDPRAPYHHGPCSAPVCGSRHCQTARDRVRLVEALTAALDLCDDPGGPDSWSHMFQGRQSVFVDDIEAVITAALTPKENDS